VIVNDENSAPGDDLAKLRIINIAEGVRSIDLYVVAEGISIDNVAPTASSLSSGAVSPYIVSNSGRYDVVATERGSKNPIALRRQTFAANEVSSIVVADVSGGDGAVNVIVLRDR
jgi:ribosomal protein S5